MGNGNRLPTLDDMDRFIDYEPGPDLRRYADAIAAGEFAGRPDSGADGS